MTKHLQNLSIIDNINKEQQNWINNNLIPYINSNCNIEKGDMGEDFFEKLFFDIKKDNSQGQDFTSTNGLTIEVKITVATKKRLKNIRLMGSIDYDGPYSKQYTIINHNDVFSIYDKQISSYSTFNQLTCTSHIPNFDWYIGILMGRDGYNLYFLSKNTIQPIIGIQHDKHGDSKSAPVNKIKKKAQYVLQIPFDNTQQYSFLDIINQIEQNDTNK